MLILTLITPATVRRKKSGSTRLKTISSAVKTRRVTTSTMKVVATTKMKRKKKTRTSTPQGCSSIKAKLIKRLCTNIRPNSKAY